MKVLGILEIAAFFLLLLLFESTAFSSLILVRKRKTSEKCFFSNVGKSRKASDCKRKSNYKKLS